MTEYLVVLGALAVTWNVLVLVLDKIVGAYVEWRVAKR